MEKEEEGGETDLDGSFNDVDEGGKQSVVEGEEREGEGRVLSTLSSFVIRLVTTQRKRENEDGSDKEGMMISRRRRKALE